MKKINLAVLLCHWLTAVTAQQHYSKAVNELISRVENNLLDGLVEPGSISKSLNAARYSGGGILITHQMLTGLTKQRYEQYMYELFDVTEINIRLAHKSK